MENVKSIKITIPKDAPDSLKVEAFLKEKVINSLLKLRDMVFSYKTKKNRIFKWDK